MLYSHYEARGYYIAYLALPNMTAEDKKRYEHMALSIFKDRNPAPPEDMSVFKCPATGCEAEINDYSIGCTSCGSNFQSCVASGKPILVRDYYKCAVCKHKTLMESIRLLNIKHCVLCHNKLDPSKLNEKNNSQPK